MKKLKKIKCDSFFEKGLKNSNENDNDLEVYK